MVSFFARLSDLLIKDLLFLLSYGSLKMGQCRKKMAQCRRKLLQCATKLLHCTGKIAQCAARSQVLQMVDLTPSATLICNVFKTFEFNNLRPVLCKMADHLEKITLGEEVYYLL